jgi:NadR type nicotinamide-nucleotide adenylyltransferase
MDTGRAKKVKRVAIVGPECTGKTDLSKFLASHFKSPWVPEMAREYLDSLGKPYEKKDLIEIAWAQISEEDRLAQQANEILICDTNLLIIKIWSEFKYGDCDPVILSEMHKRIYDLHLLTYVDIPWADDPLREHPHKREILYGLYKNELADANLHFIEIKGEQEERRKTAINAIEQIVKKNHSHQVQ